MLSSFYIWLWHLFALKFTCSFIQLSKLCFFITCVYFQAFVVFLECIHLEIYFLFQKKAPQTSKSVVFQLQIAFRSAFGLGKYESPNVALTCEPNKPLTHPKIWLSKAAAGSCWLPGSLQAPNKNTCSLPSAPKQASPFLNIVLNQEDINTLCTFIC